MILFEWDEAKAKTNRRKHGIDLMMRWRSFTIPKR